MSLIKNDRQRVNSVSMPLSESYILFRFRSLVILLLLFFSISTFAYHIRVEINNNSETLIYLCSHRGPDFHVIDSVMSDKNGIVEFKSDQKLPFGVYFIVIPPQSRFDFLLAEDQNIVIKTDARDIFGKFSISGELQYTIFAELLKNVATINKERSFLNMQKQFFAAYQPDTLKHINFLVDSLNKRQNELYRYYKSKLDSDKFLYKILNILSPFEIPKHIEPLKYQDPVAYYDYHKTHFLERVDFNCSELINTPEFVFHKLIETYCYYFFDTRSNRIDQVLPDIDFLVNKTKKNKDFNQYIISYLITRYQNHNDKRLEAIVVHVFDKFIKSKNLIWLSENDYLATEFLIDRLRFNLIGSTAKNFKLSSVNDVYVELSDFDKSYKLLWFWEPECDVCIEQTLVLKKQYSDLKFIGVEVIAINVSADKIMWKDFISMNNLEWINLIDDNPKSETKLNYGIIKTPGLFVLDPNNRIIAKHVNPTSVYEMVLKAKGRK